jgi:hypothetical protein
LGVDLCPFHPCLYLDSFPALSLVHERNATQGNPTESKMNKQKSVHQNLLLPNSTLKMLLRLHIH